MFESLNTNKKCDTIKLGFKTETILLKLENIMPTKVVAPNIREKVKFKQIVSSIREIGIIEPPAVSPHEDQSEKYYLLDGHLRIEALKDIGENQVMCLISTDDETFTYNKHINRLSIIQEHKMIVRAVEHGVSEERIAKALNVDVRSIILKQKLLDGVCKEAVDLLKDKMVSGGVFRILRRMTPMRQIECAELMNIMNVYTVPYAQALLAGTSPEFIIESKKTQKIKGIDEEQMARMQSEMLSLQNQYRVIEDTLASSVLNFTVAKGYVAKLMSNTKIVRYMSEYYPEILEEFQKITVMKSINPSEENQIAEL